MAVFDRVDGDVLFGLLATAGPDHAAGSHVSDMKIRKMLWAPERELVERAGTQADDGLAVLATVVDTV